MKYPINKDNYHRFDVMEVNKLPPRSYFIPFSTREKADAAGIKEKRYTSDKVQCLSGQWDFKFYPQPSLLPDVLDTESISFDTIDVPACWQFRGYAKPFYVNTRYQFPFDPPRIPMEEPVGKTFCNAGSDFGIKVRFQKPVNEYNFVGVYRKKFTVTGDHTYVLSFLGVASCLDLYVNGIHVGYSEGSHNTAEFDITPYIRPGENELLAVVRRWCTGTYLECQDMFRNNGIFRDVLLWELEPEDIYDIRFETKKTEAGYTAWITAELCAESRISVTLSGPGEHRVVNLSGKEAQACFEGLRVQEWTAETPCLYDVYLQTQSACVKLRVGFREVKIAGDLFTLNGKKLKLRGVNHHDTSCRNGYTMTPEEIEGDIRLCKAYNIDTIRTSHYPPDPMLLEWCDELGVYVVDEADLETHGCMTQQLVPNFNTISHDVKWQNRYLDRAHRLWGRDRLHPSVIMWSLGNEAGGWRNTDAMYDWLKYKTDLPIHYESVIHTRRVAYDVGSEMYPTVEKVRQVGQHSRKEAPLNDRPYFLCEYAHAMGVGPGAAEEYWKEIYQYDNLMGGCVWEMVDHAVLHADGSYTYGGDHGEWEHDSNFCVDGIFYPDRSPSTGAKIIRHLYRPLRIKHLRDDLYEVFNTLAFTSSHAYAVRICSQEGKPRQFSVDVPPLTKKTVRLPGCLCQGESVWAEVVNKRTGTVVSEEQLSYALPVLMETKPSQGLPMGLDICEGQIFLRKDGKVLCSATPYTILYRAPTDNDVDFFLNTRMDDYLPQKEQIVSTSVEGSRIKIVTHISCHRLVFECTDLYESLENALLVTSTLRCVKGKGTLPRFGKAFRLDSSFDNVSYLGRAGESYCDMKDHALIRQVSCQVADMTEPNIKPQESGNRCDCAWAEIGDGDTVFGFRAVDRPFELGVKPYSDEALVSMKHRSDEVRTGTYVTVSAFQMGIGTGSCGPATLPEYSYSCDQEYTLRFIIE